MALLCIVDVIVAMFFVASKSSLGLNNSADKLMQHGQLPSEPDLEIDHESQQRRQADAADTLLHTLPSIKILTYNHTKEVY